MLLKLRVKHSGEKKRLFRCRGSYDDMCFVMVSFFLILLFSNNELLKSLPFDVKPIVLERLTDYKPLVEDELDEKGLTKYTSLVLGMIYQESKGRGNDPMQSSESLGLKRNEIKTLKPVSNRESNNSLSCTKQARKRA